jgi:acetaldehyde dehydrogenase (acetylating)
MRNDLAFRDVRIRLTDMDCESCGGNCFQLGPEEEHYEAEAVVVLCCGCGEPLWKPHPDDDERMELA